MMQNISEDDYLQLSGIQHFAFCKRQWALMYLENIWADNWRTTAGIIMHERTHNEKIKEKRDGIITLRALRISSHTLGISGECDVVEFLRDESGIELNNYVGNYRPFPIEYKRGKPKSEDADKLQLCAQAICLEEMLLTEVPRGALFYGEIHRRIDVEFTSELREQVKKVVCEMHKMLVCGVTPNAKVAIHCAECSLNNKCMPTLQQKRNVQNYIQEHVKEN